MFLSKRGAALLQVLLVAAVLAGIATMLLRATLSRTTTSRQVQRTVSTQLLVESCMAEVNAFWVAKNADAFARDLNDCIMYCDDSEISIGTSCSEWDRRDTYTCSSSINGVNYTVNATMSGSNGNCEISYIVNNAGSL